MTGNVAYHSTRVNYAVEWQLNDPSAWVSYNPHMAKNLTRIHKDKRPHRIHYIAEWLERRGIRQADVVRDLGVDKGTVSKWCAGGLPGEANLLSLAAFLHVEPTDLFRHPDDDWIARLFKDRSESERETMILMLRAVAQKDKGSADTGT